MLSEFDLTGKRVLITGAGRGIGRGIALVLAEAGADVGVTALGEANAAKVAAEVQALGRKGYGWAADGTRVEPMQRVAEQALSSLGGLDILINCIGDAINGAVAPIPGEERRVLTEADWHNVIDLNLTQAFVGCHVLGPHFIGQGSGSVINVSSFAAVRASAYSTAYAAAKTGLTRFTESLALEWAPFKVRVNAIAPGSFPDLDALPPEERAQREARGAPGIPLGRAGRMRDVGLLALYLASDASVYLTGQSIAIDGGRSIV